MIGENLTVLEESVVAHFRKHPGQNWQEAAPMLEMDAEIILNTAVRLTLWGFLERVPTDEADTQLLSFRTRSL